MFLAPAAAMKIGTGGLAGGMGRGRGGHSAWDLAFLTLSCLALARPWLEEVTGMPIGRGRGRVKGMGKAEGGREVGNG